MIGTFRMCLVNLIRLLVAWRPSHKRSIYLLAFLLSLLLLGLFIGFSIKKGKADTPTPTPVPHDMVIPVPPEEYDDTLEALFSGGSIGYDMTYVRIPQSDYTYGDTIVTFENNAIQYNNWVEFSYISIPYVPTDNWRIDLELHSANGYFTPEYIQYKGVRYNDTIIELDTGAVFGITYNSSVNACKISFVGSGPLGDENTTGFQNQILDGTLTVFGSWHMSSPGTFYLDYFGYIYDDPEEIPTVFPEAPTFPDVATDEAISSDTPSYNGLFSAINSTLDWIGNVIITATGSITGAINNLIGDPAELIAELENIDTAFQPLSEIMTNDDENGVLDMSQALVDLIESTPTEAVLAFSGLKMNVVEVYNGMPSWLSITGYHVSGGTHQSIVFGSGSYLIPPFRLDFGAMFTDMGIDGWIHLVIRILAYGCVVTYMYSLFRRVLSLVSGDSMRSFSGFVSDRYEASNSE